MASFPLRCDICPKNPNFSDLSHLLTHVGSKGHLSHYFKAQVRSRQEPSIREELARYDQWYDQNQIEKLLSQRMMLKDSKRLSNNAKAVAHGATKALNPRRAAVARNSAVDELLSPVKEEQLIDPQLSSVTYSSLNSAPKWLHSIKTGCEPRNKKNTPISSTHHWTPEKEIRSHGKAIVKWETIPRTPPSNTSPTTEVREYHDEKYNDHSSPSQGPYTRAMRRKYSTMAKRELNLQPDTKDNNDRSQSPVEHRCHTSHGHEERLSETTRLKGMVWPGMDLFDSASPEGRRTRNQKKHYSILEHMQAISEEIKPTELIFSPSWDLRKEREITGQVESSPMTEPTPKPKRQRRNARRIPLTGIDRNLPITGRKPRNAASDMYHTTEHRPFLDYHEEGRAISRAMFQNDTRADRCLRRPPDKATLDPTDIQLKNLKDQAEGLGVQRNIFPDFETVMHPHHTIESNSTMSYHFLRDRSFDVLEPSSLGHPYRNVAPLSHTLHTGNYDLSPTGSNYSFHDACNLSAFAGGGLQRKENNEPSILHSRRTHGSGAFSTTDTRAQRHLINQNHLAPSFSSTIPVDFAAFHTPPYQHHTINPLAFSLHRLASHSQTSDQPLSYCPEVLASNLYFKPNGSEDPERSGTVSSDETIDDGVDHPENEELFIDELPE